MKVNDLHILISPISMTSVVLLLLLSLLLFRLLLHIFGSIVATFVASNISTISVSHVASTTALDY